MASNQREMWYEVIKCWCKNLFGGVEVDSAPPHIQKALDLIIEDDANRSVSKSSKTVQGVVVESYTEDGFSSRVRSILKCSSRMYYSKADLELM